MGAAVKMRRTIGALLLGLTLWAQPAAATWTLTASGSVGGTGSTNAISIGTLNTGSSNVFFALVSCYFAAPAAGDMADTQTNAYTLITTQTSAADSNLRVATFYKISPSNSGSLTVTYTPAVGTICQFPSMVFYAFTQGSAPTFNTNVQTGTNSSGSVQPGSIGNANDLVVEAMAYYAVTAGTIDSSFSAVTEVTYSAGSHIGLEAAWKEIASATNPTWTVNGANAVAAQAAAVSGTGGGGGGCTIAPSLMLMGVGNCKGN